MQTVVDRIIAVASNGNQNAKNNRSSATGLGQFLDQTWLDLIRAYRSDLMKGRSQEAILELRRDGTIAREITAVFMEKNTAILKKRGLPVTPATLYLAHFAGPAGAVAILSALENADAATSEPESRSDDPRRGASALRTLTTFHSMPTIVGGDLHVVKERAAAAARPGLGAARPPILEVAEQLGAPTRH
jgi:hypothetical protein